MKADLRCFSVLVLLLALMESDLPAQPLDQTEKAAIAAIEKLGGKVCIRESRVSGVILANTKVTDAGLVHLKGLTNLKGLVLLTTKVTD